MAVLLAAPARGQVRARPVPLPPVSSPVLPLSMPAAPSLTLGPGLPSPVLPGPGPAANAVASPAPRATTSGAASAAAATAGAAAAARPGPLLERRGAGLLVVDLKDSTKLYQEVGNRRAHALTEAVMDYAAATARALGGLVARRLGDGLLIVFDDAASAAAAGLAVQAGMPAARERFGRQGLSLRAAVHAGRVVEDRSGGGFDVYGQTVERVLALSASGRPGTLILDEGLARHPSVAAVMPPRLEPGEGGTVQAVPGPAAPPTGGWAQAELRRAEVVERATLFADLADWPARYESDGRRSAVATTAAFHAFARAVVLRNGGEFVKTSGEAVMASFPGAAAAVRAAAELQKRASEFRDAAPLGLSAALRVGVSYGRVVRASGLDWTDYFGNTVNAAARLMKAAGPGGALVSAMALRDVEARRLLAAPGHSRERLALKGFLGPVEVVRVESAAVPTGRRRSLARRLRALARAVMRMLPKPAKA